MDTGDCINQRYEVIEVLGKGGFGCTYLVRDLNSGIEYAAKELTFPRDDIKKREKAEKLFKREVATLKKLKHSQIPKFVDYFEIDQELYLIQEYIVGVTLDKKIADTGLYQEGEVINLLEQLLTILKYVHKKRIIHRDIKPSNLIIRNNDNELFLIDFGGVKDIAQTQLGQSQTSVTVISSGDYTSPEQKLGDAQFCSDIYALGVTAIAAITGNNLPRNNEGKISCDNLANVSHELKIILAKMIEPHWQSRYQKAEDVLRDLDYIQKSSPSQVTTVPTVIPSNQNPHQTEVLSFALGIAFALIGVVAMYSICVAAGVFPPTKEKPPNKKSISSELLWLHITTNKYSARFYSPAKIKTSAYFYLPGQNL